MVGTGGQYGWIDQTIRFPAMSLCASCGQPVNDQGELCAYHTFGGGEDWATGNRIMCDFIHRGIVSLAPRELTDISIEVLELEAAQAA